MAEIPLKVPELKPNYYIQGVIKVNTEQLWRVMEE